MASDQPVDEGRQRGRRGALLAAARQVVLERGLANTRVADVASATGVSPGLVHYHFATKDDLLTEMMRAVTDEDISAARQFAESDGSAVERLDRVMREFVPRDDDDLSWVLWIDSWGAALRDPTLRRISAELDQAWTDVLARVIEDGADSGEFHCTDPEASAVRLAALLDGLCVRVTLERSTMTRDELLEHARVAAALELGLDRVDFPQKPSRRRRARRS